MIGTVSATCNIIVITDPSGRDPNGVAGASLSYAPNMFQSTFLLSKDKKFAVLSGGEGEAIPRLMAIVETIKRLENGMSAADAASAANQYPGIRVMCGGPGIGAAVGGSFDAYIVTVEDDGTIKITPVSGGLAVLPPGKKGAIIHLRNTPGNPKYGTADSVRRDVAINVGKMIRDGYPATVIVGKAVEEVARDSGERYGGGAVNIASGTTTGDMFTPATLNQTGYPLDEPYVKLCPQCGWSMGFPTAERYDRCPICGSQLKTIYAYQALTDAITVSNKTVIVSVYGSDSKGVIGTTKEIVEAVVNKYGYDPVKISEAINRAIDNGLILGVNYVEPKDINVKPSARAVGVYYTPLPDNRSGPPWDLPIPAGILETLGNVQTVLGFALAFLAFFRTIVVGRVKK